jgi:hypothetical protein
MALVALSFIGGFTQAQETKYNPQQVPNVKDGLVLPCKA